jgi:hypothetical protein
MKLLFLVLLCTFSAKAQWDQMVVLNDDNFYYLSPQLVVDDSFHLHVFSIKESHATSPRTSSLIYQKFDSWGNPLSAQMVLLPDSHWIDHPAGIIMDSRHNIHIVWSRTYDSHFDISNFYYVQMNTRGDIITPPTVVSCPLEYCYSIAAPVMTEGRDGIIWIAYGGLIAKVNLEGEILSPFQFINIFGPHSGQCILAVSPNGEVWDCVRYEDDSTQSVSLIRLDTIVPYREVVSGAPWPEWINMSPVTFFIDRNGAFHYIISRDDIGEYYLRDPRDGSAHDSIMINPTLDVGAGTYFTLVNDDTLLYLEHRAHPNNGYYRFGFNLQGQLILGPLFSPRPSNFYMINVNYLRWHQGSFWLMGTSQAFNPDRDRLCMIHVTGPNEPPNAVTRNPVSNRKDFGELIVSPQPVNSSCAITMPLGAGFVTKITLYNLLGQRVQQFPVTIGPNRMIPLTISPALAAGKYYLSIRTTSRVFVGTLVYLP